MKKETKITALQGKQSVMRNAVLYAGTLAVVSLFSIGWLTANRNNLVSHQPPGEATSIPEPLGVQKTSDGQFSPKTPGTALAASTVSRDAKAVDFESRQTRESVEQSEYFETLWAQLHDPELRGSLNAQQIIASPEFRALPVDLMQRLVDEVMEMLAQGDLDKGRFMAMPSGRHESPSQLSHSGHAGDGQDAVETVTPEQQASFDEIKGRLLEKSFTQSLTVSKLLSMQEVKSLPESLRQELVTEVIQLLEYGYIDRDRFLATPIITSRSAGTRQTVSQMRKGTELDRATTTHNQWRIYENFLVNLTNPDFMANSSLEQMLTDPGLQSLPAYLKAEVRAKVAASIRRGEWGQN